jgi:hypothetical protein
LRRLPNPKRTFALGIDEPLYFSVHSDAARLAPGDGVVLHLGYYFNENSTNHPSEARLESLLDQIQPRWREEVVYKRYLPSMVASYGTPAADRNGASGLSNPLPSGCKSIYLCGDYVGSGAQLVDCSTKSTLQAVSLLLAQSESPVQSPTSSRSSN